MSTITLVMRSLPSAGNLLRSGTRRRPGTYDPTVPYDAELALRLRTLLEDEPNLAERKMFGGLAFLVDGHMAVAASSDGGLLVRVDPTTSDALIARSKAEAMVMAGRRMTGWLRVKKDDVRTTRQLTTWVRRSTDHVRTLAPKPAQAARRRSP